MIKRATPILLVEEIESALAFWVDRLRVRFLILPAPASSGTVVLMRR